MSAAAGPNFYDVLDVDPRASTEEIDDAWRSAIADLTPADRRFRLYSQAAEVLLDPDRRAAYDAELAAAAGEEDPTAGAPAPPPPDPDVAATPGPLSRIGSVITERGRRWRRSRLPADTGRTGSRRWPLVALAVVTVLSLCLTGYLLTQPSSGAVQDATAQARSAAERAIVPVLSYDHETLDEDQDEAHEYLTQDYKAEYDRFFDGVVRTNAEQTQAVVRVEVVSSAVVRASEDRAEILLFVNRPTTNKATEKPVVYKDQVRVRLEKVGDRWLVDCLITSAEGRCRS